MNCRIKNSNEFGIVVKETNDQYLIDFQDGTFIWAFKNEVEIIGKIYV